MPKRPPSATAARSANARVASKQAHDRLRARTQEWRAWYKSPEWQAARRFQLTLQPLCERCLPRVTAATVVNHKVPHRGDRERFLDPRNHESVCKPCHDGPIQAEERRAAAALT